MKGRHNHGVRQRLFDLQRQRFIRRRFRQNRSGRKQVARHGFVPLPGGHKPKWLMVHYPGRQSPLRQRLKKPAPWPIAGVGFPYILVATGGGRANPPHWHSFPPLRINPPINQANDRRALWTKERRVVLAEGHKVTRLKGDRRLAAWARMFYFKNGQAGYPIWDPDHRTPVFP